MAAGIDPKTATLMWKPGPTFWWLDHLAGNNKSVPGGDEPPPRGREMNLMQIGMIGLGRMGLPTCVRLPHPERPRVRGLDRFARSHIKPVADFARKVR